MSLIGLPEEIILLILKQLDTKSIIAVYNTCHRLRDIACMFRECNFSLSTLATANSLSLPYFDDIADHLQVLNVCGIQDLTKASLMPAMTKLKVLRKLNVAHTSITTDDLMDIYDVCPAIKSITINLTFSKPQKEIVNILTESTVVRYQNLLKNFDDVHFVFDSTSLKSRLIFKLLNETHLHSLTGTYTAKRLTNCVPENQDVNIETVCEKLNLRFVDRKGRILSQAVLPLIELENKDYVIVRISFRFYWFIYDVYCSQSFKLFFSENFGIDAQTDIEKTRRDIIDPQVPVTKASVHDVVVMVWKRSLTEYSEAFYKILFQKLQPLFPINLLSQPIKNELKLNPKNWVFFVQHPLINTGRRNYEVGGPPSKQKKTARPSEVLALDCDEACLDKKNISLTVYFKDFFFHNNLTVTLPSGAPYLKEITHLTLTGYVKYHNDFFNVLFRECTKLETLDVYTPTVATSFTECLPLSRSLKNLRVFDAFINFTSLFTTLSKCKTLENVHIDETAAMQRLPDPKLVFMNCVNLYNFTICGSLFESHRLNHLEMFNKAKADLGLHHLHVDIIQGSDFMYANSYEYQKHLSIFNHYPTYHVIRPIDPDLL